MPFSNVGILVRKIIIGLLLIGCGIVIGHYMVNEGKYSSNHKEDVHEQRVEAAGTKPSQHSIESNTLVKEKPVPEVEFKQEEHVIDNRADIESDVDVESSSSDNVNRLVDRMANNQEPPENSVTFKDDAVFYSLAKELLDSSVQMNADFEVQVRNDEWAQEMEIKIQEFFYYSKYSADVSFERAACKETLCKIAYKVNVVSLCDEVVKEMVHQEWWAFSTFQLSSLKANENDGFICTMLAEQ